MDVGVKVTVESGITLGSTSKERHACEVCLDIAIGPYVKITGSVTLIGGTKEVELLEKEWSPGKFYYSLDHEKFDSGTCPYKKYMITAQVVGTDLLGSLMGIAVVGAQVTDESAEVKGITGINGCVEFWQSAGWHQFHTIKDGKKGSAWKDIDGPVKVVLYVGIDYDDRAEQVCAGDKARSCAVITQDGRLYRWRDNGYGQIGDATLENRYEPVHIPLPGQVVMFMENNGSSAAVVQNGILGNALYMWGRNEYGQLGNGTKNNVNVPPGESLMDGVREVCLGNRLTAVIKETGELYLCGSISGQTMTAPKKVLPGQKIKQVATNQYSQEGHIAAITESGDLYLWGDNRFGQVGNGKNESNVSSPVQILQGKKVKQVSLGDGHSAAVTEDGRLYLWGDNGYGQIGNGGKQVQYVPVEISLDDQKVRQVHLAQCYSMAITEAGDLYAWGTNSFGIIGTGTPFDTAKVFTIPQKIMENVKAVDSETSGGSCNAALTEDGSLYLWGGGITDANVLANMKKLGIE